MFKNIYAVTAIHATEFSNREDITKKGLDHIVNTQTNLIQLIAKRFQVTSFFLEDFNEQSANEGNEAIDVFLQDQKGIERKLLKHFEREEKYSQYFTLKLLRALGKLRLQGIGIKFMPTETDREVIDDYIKMRSRSDKLFDKYLKDFPEKTPEVNASRNAMHWEDKKILLRYIAIYYRDQVVLGNIRQRGEEHNLFQMGLGHPLKDYNSSDTRLHRLNIEFNRGIITIRGKVRPEVINDLGGYVTKATIPMISDVLYDSQKYVFKSKSIRD